VNRIEATALFSFVALAITFDMYVLLSRCAAAPKVHLMGAVLGVLAQTAAVAIPMALHRHFSGESAGFRLRAISLGVLLCVTSFPVLETAVLYGDSIGKEKGFASAGYQCRDRMFPDGLALNKTMEPTR